MIMKGKRILSALLTLIMVFSIVLSIDYSASAAPEVKEETVELEGITAVAEKTDLDFDTISRDTSNYEFSTKKINTRTMNYSTTSNPLYSSYTVSANKIVVAEYVPQNTGWIWLDFKAFGNAADSVELYLQDVANNIWYNIPQTMYAGTECLNVFWTHVTYGKEYRLYMMAHEDNTEGMEVWARARIYKTTSSKRSVQLNEGSSRWTIASVIDSTFDPEATYKPTATYFKVTPDTTGVMSVFLKGYGASSSGNIVLCDSNRKALSEEVWYDVSDSFWRVYFGVQSGKTYYLRVSDIGGSGDSSLKFGIRYSMSAREDRKISPSKYAKKLVRQASATHTLFPAVRANSTDWYKIYVSSKRTTQFTINTAGIKSGGIYVSVYRNGKQVGNTTTISDLANGASINITYGTTKGKTNAGTHYIKVMKGTLASGKYSIRYDK